MINLQIRYTFKFFTQCVTLLGVSGSFISQTLAGEVFSPTQKFPLSFLNDQNLTQPQIPLSLYAATVQPLPKPMTIWEVERFVQENQSDANPFRIIQDSNRRGGKNIMTILKDRFSTFYSLLGLAKADLKDILVEENKNMIVFAPTEAAWAALGEQRQQLIAIENRERLRQLLRNHIVVEGISEAQLQQGSVQTLGGEKLKIKQLDHNQTEVNGMKILNNKDFIQAINQESIIIEIDRLLFEPEL